MTQENHAVAVGEAVETQKYLVVAYTEGDGKFEQPEVIKASRLQELEKRTEDATGGNWTVAIIHEFELSHWIF